MKGLLNTEGQPEHLAIENLIKKFLQMQVKNEVTGENQVKTQWYNNSGNGVSVSGTAEQVQSGSSGDEDKQGAGATGSRSLADALAQELGALPENISNQMVGGGIDWQSKYSIARVDGVF